VGIPSSQSVETMIRTLFLLFLATVVSGCGFHLRGQVELASVMAAPWVTGQDPELVIDLRQGLRQSGVAPVKDSAAATVFIDLATVEYSRSVKSVDSKGVATGYTLQYNVIYRVVEPSGQVLVSNSQLSFSRDLIYQSTQLLQKKEEEKALKASMRDEIVGRIIRRLSSVALNIQSPAVGLVVPV